MQAAPLQIATTDVRNVPEGLIPVRELIGPYSQIAGLTVASAWSDAARRLSQAQAAGLPGALMPGLSDAVRKAIGAVALTGASEWSDAARRYS
jgi:hypothetical protein